MALKLLFGSTLFAEVKRMIFMRESVKILSEQYIKLVICTDSTI